MADVQLKKAINARLLTLKAIHEEFLPTLIHPVPKNPITIKQWLNSWGIPRLKLSPRGRRGGAAIYYDISSFEKELRRRVTRTVDPYYCKADNPRTALLVEEVP